ncbi:E3 ubiquitin-protein ligase CIP8-like [Cocos nucifera]|uniref:E3 ubiquitin-protein ligase CIP8-like n=1 Tax=Cocos nucifera TaxID=13894 RepID=A0A8K0HW62_COCNU|nr:E3 ubiquitin-protein ligase CIP8-like [Cocos nucifera]
MAISETHILGDSVFRLEARGVLGPQVQPQVVVRIRLANFDGSADTLFIVSTTTHRFHLGQIPLPRALPVIVSFLATHNHGVHQPDCPLCDVLLRRFSSRVAAQMTAVSALELLVHMGQLLGPAESDEDVEVMHEWMLENPPEEEEEMAGDVYEYFLHEGLGASHGGSHGVPPGGSCLERLQRFTYGRGDGVREEECVICLMEFDAEAEVSRMPCSHTFHCRCIIRWLEMSNVCPICRSQMPTASSN